MRKKCKLCQKKRIDFTSPGSNNKADIFIKGANYLTYYGDDYVKYILQCNYCPQCGKKLII